MEGNKRGQKKRICLGVEASGKVCLWNLGPKLALKSIMRGLSAIASLGALGVEISKWGEKGVTFLWIKCYEKKWENQRRRGKYKEDKGEIKGKSGVKQKGKQQREWGEEPNFDRG